MEPKNPKNRMRQQAVQSSISQAVLAARKLAEIRRKKYDPIPEGWFTRMDYEIQNSLHRSTAIKELNELAQSESIEISSWPTLDSCGRTIKTTIYKLK